MIQNPSSFLSATNKFNNFLREVKIERGRKKSNRDEDFVKRYDNGNMHVREREKEREKEGGGKA
jgi:hypothetical protein